MISLSSCRSSSVKVSGDSFSSFTFYRIGLTHPCPHNARHNAQSCNGIYQMNFWACDLSFPYISWSMQHRLPNWHTYKFNQQSAQSLQARVWWEPVLALVPRTQVSVVRTWWLNHHFFVLQFFFFMLNFYLFTYLFT